MHEHKRKSPTRIPLLLLILLPLTISVTSDNNGDNSPVALFPDEAEHNYVYYSDSKKYDRLLFGSAHIGIDLGHSHTRVGVDRNGILEIIPNDLGETETPNWISFADDGTILVGKAAMNQSSPNTPIFDIKSLVGRGFDDPEVQREVDKVSGYKIVNKSGKPYVRVDIGGETKELNPKDLFAAFLWKIKDMAENYLHERIRETVLTYPDSYGHDYRGALKEIADRVGLGEARAIGHHVAAILAHKLDKRRGERNHLVLGLSQENCQLNIAACKDGAFEFIVSKGDSGLGGKEFNRRLTNHFVELIKSKYGRDVGEDGTVLAKLVEESERAKIALSSQDRAVLEIENLNFSEPLTRALFEEMNEDLFDRMRALVEKALEESGLEKTDIDGVVLVGKSTRIPKVRKLFKDMFGGKEPESNGVDPDEVLLKGALVIAQNIETDQPLDIHLRLVIRDGVGIRTVGGEMTKLFRRKTFIPGFKKASFTTNRDNQSTVEIKLFAGESRSARDCREIGGFNLSGIVPAPRGVARIEISLELDENYCLSVKAEEKASNVSVSKYFAYYTSKDDEIYRIIEEYLLANETENAQL